MRDKREWRPKLPAGHIPAKPEAQPATRFSFESHPWCLSQGMTDLSDDAYAPGLSEREQRQRAVQPLRVSGPRLPLGRWRRALPLGGRGGLRTGGLRRLRRRARPQHRHAVGSSGSTCSTRCPRPTPRCTRRPRTSTSTSSARCSLPAGTLHAGIGPDTHTPRVRRVGTRDVGDACTLPSVRVHTIGAPIANVACRVMICPSTSRSSLSVWVERAVGARRWGRLYTTFGASPHHRRADCQRRM